MRLFDLDVWELPSDDSVALIAGMRTSASASFSCTYLR